MSGCPPSWIVQWYSRHWRSNTKTFISNFDPRLVVWWLLHSTEQTFKWCLTMSNAWRGSLWVLSHFKIKKSLSSTAIETNCLHQKLGLLTASMFTNVNNPFRTFPIVAYMSATEHIIGNKKKKPQVIGPSIMLSIYFFIKSYFPPLMKSRERKGKMQ